MDTGASCAISININDFIELEKFKDTISGLESLQLEVKRKYIVKVFYYRLLCEITNVIHYIVDYQSNTEMKFKIYIYTRSQVGQQL